MSWDHQVPGHPQVTEEDVLEAGTMDRGSDAWLCLHWLSETAWQAVERVLLVEHLRVEQLSKTDGEAWWQQEQPWGSLAFIC